MDWAFDRIHDALSGLRDVISTFTGWCSRMMADWGTKYIIGPFAFTLFWTLYDIGWQVRYKVVDFRDRLDDVGDFLTGIEDGWKLDELISNIFGGWRELTDHGKQFVFNKLTGFWPDFYWFYQDPGWMLEFWLGEKWHWLQGWLDDRKGAIFQGLTDYWPDFYWFYQDPGYMLEFWLTERVPGLAPFLAGPKAWLRSEVGELTDGIQEAITGRMLHILQVVIERTWDGGEAE